MALKALIDKLEDAPEEDRKHYVAMDGKFKAAIEPVNGYDLQDIAGMNKVMQEVKDDRAALRGKLDEAEGEKGSLNRQVSELTATQDAKAKEKFEAYKVELTAQYEEKVKSLNDDNESLKVQLDDVEIRQAATTLLAGKGFTQNGINLMLKTEIKEHMKRINGEVKIVDDKGDELTSDDFKKYTAESFIGERLVGQYPEFVKSELNPGMGAPNGSDSGGIAPGTSIKQSEMKDDPQAVAAALVDQETGKPIEGVGIEFEK